MCFWHGSSSFVYESRLKRQIIPLLPIWNSFPVCTEKFCFFDKKFYICLRFLKACADGCTVSMGIPPSRLSRRTLDWSIIVPCTGHRRIGLQSRSHSRGFSLTCRGRVMAYRSACSPHKECTQVFGYSVVKVRVSEKIPSTYKDKKGPKINLFCPLKLLNFCELENAFQR